MKAFAFLSVPLVFIGGAPASQAPATPPAAEKVAAPASWPTFRWSAGRTGAGDGTEGPLSPVLRWKYQDAQARAAILSSPAVCGGRLYVGADNSAVYCLDSRSGTPIWRAETDWEVVSSPAVTGGRVFVGEGLHTTSGVHFRCLDADTGKPVWETPIPGHVESSPTVSGGAVYFGAGDAGFYCLNSENGRPLWRFPARHIDGSPAVANGRVYVGTTRPSVVCLDAKKGTLLWECPLPYAPWGAPAISGNRLWMATGNGRLDTPPAKPAGSVVSTDLRTGRRVWAVSTGDAAVGGVAVAGGRLVLGTRGGQVMALDAATGTKRWSWKAAGPVLSLPAIDGRRVYAGAADGQVQSLTLNEGSPIWAWSFQTLTRPAPLNLVSAPAIAEGRLYLAGTNGYIACLEQNQQAADAR